MSSAPESATRLQQAGYLPLTVHLTCMQSGLELLPCKHSAPPSFTHLQHAGYLSLTVLSTSMLLHRVGSYLVNTAWLLSWI